MQVNTDNVAVLHKAVLESELERLPMLTLPTTAEVIVKEFLKNRISELKEGVPI